MAKKRKPRFKVSYLRCTRDSETVRAKTVKDAKQMVLRIELGSRQFSRALGVTRKDRVQILQVKRLKH